MVSLSVWLSLLLALFVISLTPGAGAINTMSNSLAEGWLRSFWGILGQCIALITHIIIVAAGVGLLVSRSELLFNLIRFVGAAYLVYLGLRMLFSKTDADNSPDLENMHQPGRESAISMIRRGFWVNILNPKAIVFFLAFLPQFIDISEPQLPQYLVFTASSVTVDIIVMWFVYANISRPFARFTRQPRGRRVLNSVFGVLFIAVAALLVFMH